MNHKHLEINQNESQQLRNELQIFRNKPQVQRSESQTCKSDLQIQTVKRKSQKTNEPQKTFVNNKSHLKK